VLGGAVKTMKYVPLGKMIGKGGRRRERSDKIGWQDFQAETGVHGL